MKLRRSIRERICYVNQWFLFNLLSLHCDKQWCQSFHCFHSVISKAPILIRTIAQRCSIRIAELFWWGFCYHELWSESKTKIRGWMICAFDITKSWGAEAANGSSETNKQVLMSLREAIDLLKTWLLLFVIFSSLNRERNERIVDYYNFMYSFG